VPARPSFCPLFGRFWTQVGPKFRTELRSPSSLLLGKLECSIELLTVHLNTLIMAY
jgi:hypothetical protein